MKTTVIQLLLTGILFVSFACTADFEKINTNPNAGEKADEVYYLTKVIISTAYDYQKEAYMGKPAAAGRYMTRLRNAGDDTFGWTSEGWDSHYYRLSENKTFHDQAIANGRDQYVATSLILGVFNFAYVTDLWGDIPYSEALKSKDEQIVYPKYDKQEEIYPDLIAKLKEANTLLKSSTLPIDASADVMYGGDVLKWRKFANSLRLRLLLKASDKLPDALSTIQEMLNNPSEYPLFESNADNAEIPYVVTHKWPGGPTGGGGNLTDEYAEFIKRRPSKEIIDFMQSRNDPRLSLLFDEVADPASGLVDKNPYVGAPVALISIYDYNGGGDNISTLNKSVFYLDLPGKVKASMMIYPEVCFMIAEVMQQKGVTVSGKTAQSFYEEGIKASLLYWGASSESAEGYLIQDGVSYDGTLKQLIGQKWASLFIKGAEGWFDYRRTNDILGFNGGINPEGAKQTTIPFRYIYPDGERAQNKKQYDEALKIFGADDINTKMWLIK